MKLSMNNAQRLNILQKTGKSVFSSRELVKLWGIQKKTFNDTVKRMVDKGLLYRITRGYYSLKEDFNVYELANSIITPSYISSNSALFYYGISFQNSQTIESTSLLNYKRKILNYNFVYFSMKKELFFNPEGIDYKNNISIAIPERAILDCYYFGMYPNIDNFNKINQAQLRNLMQYYPKTVQSKVKKLLDYGSKRV